MTLAQFLSILRAHKWVALLVFALTVGSALGISLMLPKTYTATASVVIDIKPDPVGGAVMAHMLTPAYMATQVDVMNSDRVARRVVRNLKLTEQPAVRAQWQEATKGEGDIEQWLVSAFETRLDVKPSRESNVISVSYRSNDPRFSATMANAFVQAYMETSNELRVDPARQYSSFFDQRAKEARDQLEKAQAKLSSYQRENGIVAGDERLDVETARLNELSSQLVMLQGLSAESSSRQAQAQGASADRLQEVLNNPLVASLKVELSRNEARLQELTSRLGDNHPQVVEARANIAELRSRVEAETRRVSGGVGVTANINRSREGQVRAQLEAQRAKVVRLKQLRDEGAVLVRDVESAQRNYEAVRSRFSQTSLESQATQGNASVLTQATPPPTPSSPNIVRNVGLSLFLGIALGIAAAVALELLDRRVRAVEDVRLALDLPVLGVMPKPMARSRLGRQPIPLMQQRLVASLPSPTRDA
jgi:chain length determinant protein EpsF